MQQDDKSYLKVKEETIIKKQKYRMYLLQGRLNSNYSINRLAKDCGITRQHYARIESGYCKARISFRVMGLIATTLGLDLNKCFKEEQAYLKSVGYNNELSDY